MTMWLRQSTAVTVKIGPFLDATDGASAETGLTIAQADVRLSKAGGNIAQKTEATSCTHDELGVYDCPLDVTDTDTVGRLRIDVQVSGALPVWAEYMVIPAAVYDSLVAGTDWLGVDLQEVTDGASDIATAVLAATVDMTGTTDKTVEQVLRVAWGQAAGKWTIVGKTLTIYAPDNTTAIATLTLDSATAPTSRTPA